MSKAGALVVAVAAGFALGFLWGRGTRDALSANTRTEFAGGVLSVHVDAAGAAREGLLGLLR